MNYCLQTNDGRYVTQRGTVPYLTDNPNLAYCWDDPAVPKAKLDGYFNALQRTERRSFLALSVQPFTAQVMDVTPKGQADIAGGIPR